MTVKVEIEKEINVIEVAEDIYDTLFDSIDDYFDYHYDIRFYDLSKESYKEFLENLMKVLKEKFEKER